MVGFNNERQLGIEIVFLKNESPKNAWRMASHDPISKNAEWKIIQKNTFTRWCNEHLKVEKQVIHDLDTDLRDGIKLIKLLEILTAKKVATYFKFITVFFKSLKISNVEVALDFIRNETDIDLANISK